MRTRWIPCALAALSLQGAALAQVVVYVDAAATGAADGTSWDDAYPSLQDGLAAANSGDQVWVAEGTYRPDVGAAETPGDRLASFWLTDDVSVHGGFLGTEATLAARAGSPKLTMLSGDLANDDLVLGNAENSYHVVRAQNVLQQARLDGFLVTGGNADVAPDVSGGGLYLQDSMVELVDVCVEGNASTSDGAGIAGVGDLRMIDCEVRDNLANGAPGVEARGGGIRWVKGTMWMERVLLTGNRAGFVRACGGAMFLDHCTVVMDECTLEDNSAIGTTSAGGGAMYAIRCALEILRCGFFGNGTVGVPGSGASRGGAMFVDSTDSWLHEDVYSGNMADLGSAIYEERTGTIIPVTALRNCTLAGNLALDAGGSALQLHVDHGGSIDNSILWGNSAAGATDESAQISWLAPIPIFYSCVQGWTFDVTAIGVGNTSVDPLFLDPDGDDDLVGTPDDDLRLGPGSPVRDAASTLLLPPDTFDVDGDSDTAESLPIDFDGHPRQVDHPFQADTGDGPGDAVDMGAYESQGSLYAYPRTISLETDGAQRLVLEAGVAEAGNLYILLGTISGTTPGFTFEDITLPLNVDLYFTHTLTGPNNPPLSNSFSTLGALGDSTARFEIPAGAMAPLLGLSIHHAYATIQVQPTFDVPFISPAARCDLVE